MEKIKVTVSGLIDEPHYPLCGLNDLLYKAIDYLTDVESRQREGVKFPIVKRFKDEGNYIEVRLEEE